MQRKVLTDVHDSDGVLWRAVDIEDGELVIVGHDLGPGVERALGASEYEFQRRFSVEDTAQLRRLLGLDADADLLGVIEERFQSTFQLEKYAREHGIHGSFWSRRG